MIRWIIGNASGTSLRGYFDPLPYSFAETVARLKTLSGQDPTTAGDGYKTSVEFSGTFKGQPFTLYDYKGDRSLHVGGTSALDVAGLLAALRVGLGMVVPSPYSATERYDDVDGHTHGWSA